jgi:hypothetical protein
LESGTAKFSADGTYRYRLRRRWGDNGELLWVMLNPSKADADSNDRTLDQITFFSKNWGFGSLSVVNLYALVSTNPAALRTHEDPIGPENDAAIALAALEAPRIAVAWGAGAPDQRRVEAVSQILRANMRAPFLECLGQTMDGHPRHPLRLSRALRLETFDG